MSNFGRLDFILFQSLWNIQIYPPICFLICTPKVETPQTVLWAYRIIDGILSELEQKSWTIVKFTTKKLGVGVWG